MSCGKAIASVLSTSAKVHTELFLVVTLLTEVEEEGLTFKMEAVYSCQKLVPAFWTARCNKPEDHIIQL